MSHAAASTGPRIFFSVGDLSADQHGANLIDAIKQRAPNAQFEGFGGDRMAEAGCELLFPLCNFAVMGIVNVLKNLPTFLRLKKQAVRRFDEQRPDALILIDYPGFNIRLAKDARRRGIPVYYFIPPQLWAWGGWRVRKLRRCVDHVYSCLPFEQEWFQQRKVSSSFVGHPYFDELREHRLDGFFVAKQQSKPGTIIGLLPGSRAQELERHTTVLLETAERIHRQRPDARFLVACLKEEHATFVEARLRDWKHKRGSATSPPLEIIAGKTSEIIHLAHSCVATSGSVSLELLYRSTPSVTIYQGNRIDVVLAKLLKTCRFITLVNLLADRELFPEYLSARLSPDVLAEHVLDWLRDPKGHDTLRGELDQLRERIAKPGACAHVAEQLIADITSKRAAKAA